ncbi:MAG: phosphoribosylaminoimidazolesuccinocarboxamide synthase [Thermoproteus sp.]
MELIYEGKAKRIYRTDRGLIMEFKDEVTAGDGARRDAAPGKGILAAELSSLLLKYIEAAGVPTHLIEFVPPRSMLVRPARVLPLEIIVRYKAYGSFLKRMPHVRPLAEFRRPIVEFHLKDDRLHDPLLLEDDVVEAGLATEAELDVARRMALKAATALRELYRKADCDLLDVKFEFGRIDGELVLVDEISGDTFRVLCGGEHLDKEYYRRTGDVVGLVERYKKLLEITSRLLGELGA